MRKQPAKLNANEQRGRSDPWEAKPPPKGADVVSGTPRTAVRAEARAGRERRRWAASARRDRVSDDREGGANASSGRAERAMDGERSPDGLYKKNKNDRKLRILLWVHALLCENLGVKIGLMMVLVVEVFLTA